MKSKWTFLMALFSISFSLAQNNISGTVTDKKGNPLIGASILIQDSYDGGITNEVGHFSFTSNLSGKQVLIISYLGYQSKMIASAISEMTDLEIKLKESTQSLDAVEISASTFKAGDNSKVAVLKPLDIVTTAGSMGDVIAAMQTLPGTQSNSEDGRLFVRGGEARETSIYVDGLKVFSPFTRSVQGTPSRGRYSPFLFKGISFNTGGYDTSFGQALSGILDLQTIDEPNATETNLSLMSVGLGFGHTQKSDKQSISLNATYIDLSPYFEIASSRLDWMTPYRGFSGEGVYRYKHGKTGLFKSYLAGDWATIRLIQTNLNTAADEEVGIRNANIYSNNSYRNVLNDKTSIFLGLSAGINHDQIELDDLELRTRLIGSHLKASLKTIFREDFILNYGTETFYQIDQVEKVIMDNGPIYQDDVERSIAAAYVDTDYFFSKSLAIKPGIRMEYNGYLQTFDILPRITLAQKISKNAQLSLAIGSYSQEVEANYLYDNNHLINERANQYLINYNYKVEKHILRAEAYYKDYKQLISYTSEGAAIFNEGNDGFGEAYGLDLFWRANQMIRKVDFWVTYSWLQHKRKYLDYPVEATPEYSTTHNLSIVSKVWFEKLQSQLGLTYQMASGRPYENPNTVGFLNEQSGIYQNVSLSWAYLISQQKILFASVSNLTGFNNEFGNRYADQPDINGVYPGEAILPSTDSFFFVGFFITMSKDKTKNQLDNL